MCPILYGATFSFFFSSRRRHTRFKCDWSSDVCSSDLLATRQVKGIENEGLALCVEHASKRFCRLPATVHIVYVQDVKVARANQLPHILADRHQLPFALDIRGLLLQRGGQVANLRFEDYPRDEVVCMIAMQLVILRAQVRDALVLLLIVTRELFILRFQFLEAGRQLIRLSPGFFEALL